MRISDWSSDVCSSDLGAVCADGHLRAEPFDLAGGAMDRWPVRLALGVLADSSSGRHCCLADRVGSAERPDPDRSEEHTSELQSLMRISYAVFCLKKKNQIRTMTQSIIQSHIYIT